MDRAKTDHFLVETESAFQGRGVVATPARAVGEHPPTILMSRDSFALDLLCKVIAVCAVVLVGTAHYHHWTVLYPKRAIVSIVAYLTTEFQRIVHIQA